MLDFSGEKVRIQICKAVKDKNNSKLIIVKIIVNRHDVLIATNTVIMSVHAGIH